MAVFRDVKGLAGRRAERAFALKDKREHREWLEELGYTAAAAQLKAFGDQRKRKRKRGFPVVLRSETRESTFEPKDLLPKGLYVCTLTHTGEPQPSSFTRKDGSQAVDFLYLTFEAHGGRSNGKEFDIACGYELRRSVNKQGTTTWTSLLQQIVEAFENRELGDDEDGDALLADIIASEKQAQVVLSVKTAKNDSSKQFNSIDSILPYESAPQPNGRR
jgi:hypothetical protein